MNERPVDTPAVGLRGPAAAKVGSAAVLCASAAGGAVLMWHATHESLGGSVDSVLAVTWAMWTAMMLIIAMLWGAVATKARSRGVRISASVVAVCLAAAGVIFLVLQLDPFPTTLDEPPVGQNAARNR